MIHVRTFGAVELRRGEVEVRSVLSQPKRLALFVHILLGSPSGFLNRDALLARFWPDSDAERARNSLRQALHYLRRSLGEDVIESRGDEIGCPPGTVHCDALEFVRALRGGRLEEALELYRGDFLPAFFVEDAPDAESWLDEQRTWYRRQAFQSAGALADSRGADHRPDAVEWARRACAIEPLDEGAARRLIRLLAEGGEAAAALAAYDDFEGRLGREHGIEPGPETRALVASIRAAATPEPGATARDSVRLTEVAPDRTAAGARVHARAPEPPAYDGSTRDGLDGGDAQPAVRGGPDATPRPASVVAPVRGRWGRRPLLLAAAVVLLLLGVAGWQLRLLDAGPDVSPSVAVLPFANMSGDAAHDYLSDAMAEELLGVLTRVPGLKVAARSSSFSFRGRNVPVDSVARALGVTHVVEGSLRVVGSKLRIAVQLIEASSGFQVWSDSYDRDAHDVLGVQDEISRAVAKSLQVQLSPAIARPAASETKDAEAYRLLLRANQVMRTGSTREVLGEARALLEEALRRDPTYARAMAALANVLTWQAQHRYTDADSGYARARELAQRSIARYPTVEAHLVLARDAELQQWDTARADAHFRSALELNPVDPRALQFRAMFLARNGRVDEGIAAARTAVELDPLHPGAYNNLAVVLLEDGRLDEAHDAYTAALRVSPEDPVILGNLANLMARQQRWDEALAYLDRAVARTPDDVQTIAQRTSILLRSGRRDEGMAKLKELEAWSAFPRYRLAVLYTNVGDVEKILDLLEQSVDRREDWAVNIRNPDLFRGMRHHPRFVQLLERVGP